MAEKALIGERVLMAEYKKLSQETWATIDLIRDNIFEWDVALIVLNPDSLYYGGYFKARMTFPKEYPYKPPDFRFLRPLHHPNVYPDGRLCVSILHQPGEDEMSGELASERWSPAQNAESVLISILSLLDDAEVSSPANVDASIMLRKEPEKYKEMVAKDLERSKADIPPGFTMPRHEDAFKSKKQEEYIIAWGDSDQEDDFDDEFGGSESDLDMDDYESEENIGEDMEDTTVSDNDDDEEPTSEGASR